MTTAPKPQETPRTDYAVHEFCQLNPQKTSVDMWGIPCVDADFARQLERELAEANEKAHGYYCELATERAARAAAEKLLTKIANANVIFPSLCVNNGEAWQLTRDLEPYRDAQALTTPGSQP